jgi:hypothetical protein
MTGLLFARPQVNHDSLGKADCQQCQPLTIFLTIESLMQLELPQLQGAKPATRADHSDENGISVSAPSDFCQHLASQTRRRSIM